MKKIFTLIAMALMAVSANAKVDVDLSSIAPGGVIEFTGAWNWKGVTLSTGELVTDDAAKTADDSGVTYFDASAYDYFCVKYTTTCDVNVIVQLNCLGTVGQWGAEFNQVNMIASPAASFVGIALGENKNKVNQVAFQNQGATGTMTIVEAYWATTEEYEAAQAEEDAKEKTLEMSGEAVVDLAAGGYGWTQGAAGAGWLAKDVTLFNTMVFEVASCTGKCKAVLQGPDDWGADVEFAASEEAATYAADLSTLATLNQYAFQNLNKPDESESEADIQATTIKFTKIYLTSKKIDEFTGVQTLKSSTKKSEVRYNLAGQKVDASYKGVVIMNGKKMVVK